MATFMAERVSFAKRVNLCQKAAKFGVLSASDPRADNAAKQIFMAHVVSERRVRKLEKQDAEAVVGSEAGSYLRHRRKLLEKRDQKSASLKELKVEMFGSEEDFFT